jgi:hypothetical protein
MFEKENVKTLVPFFSNHFGGILKHYWLQWKPYMVHFSTPTMGSCLGIVELNA